MSCIPADHLHTFIKQCLVAAGSSEENAEIVSKSLVLADKRGISSHGVNRLDMYCNELHYGAVKPSGKPSIFKDCQEGAAACLVDGDNLQGAVVGKYCMELAIEKAEKYGVGFVVAFNSNHYGISGAYAMMASEKGLIGLSGTNTTPFVAPTRSKERAIGTNPIAIAAPTETEPVVLDMATPTVALGKIEVKKREGLACPQGWGLDKEGKPTTSAEEIMNGALTPLGGAEETGGYKGYGLGLMVDMLCGVLGRAHFGKNIGGMDTGAARGEEPPLNIGHFFMCLHPSFFGMKPGEYPHRLQSYVDELHGLELAPGAPGPVLVPGEPEQVTCARQEKEGITLSEAMTKSLCETAKRLGVKVPEEFVTALASSSK